ncbi:MAG TPA: hypothetical protein PKW97_03815 [Syntrophorhabdus sp.]|jgi:hypothetical protein|nr:hypothetical protein [Syntrophorhabdus sp.]OQB74192.1 MAG: hypothetical protein BWX92_03108 [Deltaproteobacteria bacterium ADurb.Bin135]HOD77257.1 hypothetical protein [Syntrophorhabdus sp.]HQM25622.1 hypothetical protein [Syntrophorhabdus sp.]
MTIDVSPHNASGQHSQYPDEQVGIYGGGKEPTSCDGNFFSGTTDRPSTNKPPFIDVNVLGNFVLNNKLGIESF